MTTSSPHTALAVEEFDGTVDRVVEMRAQGHAFSYIAAVVGLSEPRVRAVLRRHLGDRYRKRDEMIDAAAASIDWVRRQFHDIYQTATDAGNAQDRRKALEGVLRCVEGLRRLLGLDAPTRVETAQVDLSDEELRAQCERYGIPVALPPARDDVADAEVVDQSDDPTVTTNPPPLSACSPPPAASDDAAVRLADTGLGEWSAS